MKTNLEKKYKTRQPEETIEIIENFFKSKNCSLKLLYEWESEAKTYSCKYQLLFNNKTILETSGKGTSKIYAKASCYGEMYERFCAFPISTLNSININNLYKNSNVKETNIDELLNSNLEKEYLKSLFNDLNKETIEKYLKTRFGNKMYQTLYKNIDGTDSVYFYSPLRIISNTSNGFAAGNTLEEAIVQGISELYEREVEYKFLTNKKNKYYFLNLDFLSDNLKQIIKNIENLGYEVKIYDLSYNFKMPVCMLFLINKTTHKFFMHFGAFPIIDIAIERCLTEFYQGIVNTNVEKNRKKLITQNNFTELDFIDRCCSGMYEKEVVIDKLFLNSEQINDFNDLIFLKQDNYSYEEIIKQINKINLINNKKFYYKDLSLCKKMSAIHLLPDDYSNSVYLYELKQNNLFYNKDKNKFNTALEVANKIMNYLHYICDTNKIIDNKKLVNYLNDIILLIPINSIDQRNDFLDLISYILGVDFTNPYKCWNTILNKNNDFLLSNLIGGFEDNNFNTDTDFGDHLIPWYYFYLYCIKEKNTIENYNKIITALGYAPININIKDLTPAAYFNEAIIKNFQSIYNSPEYSEFINLFKKEDDANEE